MWYICLRYANQEAENDSHMAIASSRRTGSTNQATCGQRASLNHKTGARTFGVGPEREQEMKHLLIAALGILVGLGAAFWVILWLYLTMFKNMGSY